MKQMFTLTKEKRTQKNVLLRCTAFFKCQVWATQWSQLPFLPNAAGRSSICLAFLQSSLKIQTQRLPPQMDKNKEMDNNPKQSALVKTASGEVHHAEIRSEKQNNVNYYRQHVTLAQTCARRKKAKKMQTVPS